MNNNVLFIVDHKHRDLPSLSLIGYHLEKLNYKVYYCGTSMEDEIIKKKDPKYIIIPKVTYGIYNQLKWKLKGRIIIIVETEGNPQNDDQKYNITVFPDLYIFWNDHIKEHYQYKLINNNTKTLVEGYYRSDFFCEPLKNLNNKEKIKLNIGIKNNNKTITIATSTHDAHLSKQRENQNRKKTNRAYEKVPDYDMTIKSLKIQKKIMEQFLLDAQKEFGGNINFIIKPHPNETVIYWNDLIKKNNLVNCFLMIGNNINELLSISDFHISQGVCTTTAEAMLYGLETIELVTSLSHNIYSENHLMLPDHQCYSSKEIIDVIKKVMSKNMKNKPNKKIKDYSDKYFKKVDGNTCFRYAQKIHDFIYNSQKIKLKSSLFIKYHILYQLMTLRNKILFLRTLRNKNIVKEVNNFENNNTNEHRKYAILDGKKVHKEWGLFDNKIKPDDYKYWYKQFSRIGI